MAHFRWLGEDKITPPRKWVQSYGPCEQVKIPKKDGQYTVVEAPPGGFPVNSVIPFDFTDERSLRVLRADPRFEEVI